MEDIKDTIEYQRIWESLIFPKGYRFERPQSSDPVIVFIISGGICIKINNNDEYLASFHEMFLVQIDSSYEITMLEQTHLIICYAPLEVWYTEQKGIENLLLEDRNEKCSTHFYKLQLKGAIIRFLSLLETYFKEGIYDSSFYELKRQEFIFLLFYLYQDEELAQFLLCILSKDIQFMKIIVSSYLNAKNVQELAKLVNYSTSGFIKKFQKCFNDPPYKWMQKQKAKQIMTEISKGTKSLQEIANEYKFSSYQHFSVFCKAQLGAPPTVILRKKG